MVEAKLALVDRLWLLETVVAVSFKEFERIG